MVRMVLLSILFLASCRTTTTETDDSAEVKFGHLGNIQPQVLIYKKHGDTVRLCGGTAAVFDDIAWAIRIWAKELGRTLTIVKDCATPDVKFFGKDDTYAKTQCQLYNLVGRVYAWHTRLPMEIVDCGGMNRARA